MQRLAETLAVVLVVPLFERQAAGVYRNSAAVIDADGRLLGVYRKMHIPDDPLFYEKGTFTTPGDGHMDYHGERPGAANGFQVWKTRYATIGVLICWDQWYPEAARLTSLLGAPVLFYPTAIGWHLSERNTGAASAMPGAPFSARTRSPTGCTSPRSTALATRATLGAASSSGAPPSSAIHSARCWRRHRKPTPTSSWSSVTWRDSRRFGGTGHSCVTAASTLTVQSSSLLDPR